MIARREQIPYLQGDFYRDQFYRLLRWLAFSVGIIFLLMLVILYLLLIQPKVHFYANAPDGTIMSMPEAS